MDCSPSTITAMQFLFPRRHRHYKLTLYLMVAELPFTIVIITLTGIASHDLYRSLLWQDGADNGFNSAPNEVLYAAANYRPYQAPLVWSELYVALALQSRPKRLQLTEKQPHQLQPGHRSTEHLLAHRETSHPLHTPILPSGRSIRSLFHLRALCRFGTVSSEQRHVGS